MWVCENMGLFDKFKNKKKLTPKEEKELHQHLEKEKQKLRQITRNAEELNKKFKTEKPNPKMGMWIDNNSKAGKLENEGQIDEAIKQYSINVKLKTTTPLTYSRLAALYHYKKDFQSEKNTLEKGMENCDEPTIDIKKSLENVTQFLETGNWKYDCLPMEPVTAHYEIQEAKRLLKSEDKEKGIQMLENIMEDDSYNNTVYYTLYQTYKKDKKYDDMIRVCRKAIDVLGFFSNNRKEKWTEYLDKSIQLKEKGSTL